MRREILAYCFVVFANNPTNKPLIPAILTRFDALTPQERHNANSPALRRLRKEAAKVLTQGHRFEVICDRLGISRVILWRWRKNDAFKKMVKELLANLKL